MANHQATRYESNCRFLSSYLQTLQKNDDPFVNEMVKPEVIKTLIQQHPGAVFEQLSAVAPLPTYYAIESGDVELPFASSEAVLPAGNPPPVYPRTPTPPAAQTSPFSFGSLNSRSNAFALPPTFASAFHKPPPS